METVSVQLRVPKQAVEDIDKLIQQGRFASRSDAIKTMIQLYDEREKTRNFYEMLEKRSSEAKQKPVRLVKFEDL